MRLVLFATAVAAAVLSLNSAAQADEQSRSKTAHEIVVATHAADNMRLLFPQIMQQIRPLIINQGANAKDVDAFITRFQQRFDQESDRFVDLAAKIYAREFSDDDLNALLAFYGTPAGQHLLAKQPEVAKGLMAAGQQWGQMMAKDVLDQYAKDKAANQQKL